MLKNYQEWADGDTFALKINKDDFDYKYIIINNVEYDTNNQKNRKIVYYKLANDLPGNVDLEFLNKCEFLCTGITWYEDRFWPLEGFRPVKEIVEERSKIEYFPDEYGILHIYQALMFFSRKSKAFLESLKYLGNFKLDVPKDEFKPWILDGFPYIFFEEDSAEYFVDTIIKEYKNNNLQESPMFNKEYADVQRKMAKDSFEYSYVVEKMRNEYIKNIEK